MACLGTTTIYIIHQIAAKSYQRLARVFPGSLDRVADLVDRRPVGRGVRSVRARHSRRRADGE